MTETYHDGYERLLEDFGQRLEEAGTRRTSAKRSRRRYAGVGGTLVLAGIVAGTLMLAGAGSGGRLDVVAQARAALAPAGQIVHLVITTHTEMRGGSQPRIVGPEAEGNADRVTEQWSTSRPVRWRVATTVPIVTARHGTHTGLVQLSYGGGTEDLYVQALNTLNIRTGVSEDSPRASPSTLGTEPVVQVRALLDAGKLHDAGRGVVNGRTVRRLVGETPRQGNESPWPVEYDIDPATYVPLRISVEMTGMRARGNTGTLTVVSDVDRYEDLPLNNDTAALLSIHPMGKPTVHRHRVAEPDELPTPSVRHAVR